VRTIGVVLAAPALDVKLRVAEREKPVLIETFVPQFAVETLDEGILDRLARLDEAELDAPVGGPRVEGAAPKLAPVVQREPHRLAARGDDGVEGRDDRHTRQRVRDGNRGRFMPRVIHDREAAEAASGGELITDEVDAPGVVRAAGRGTRGTATRFRWRRRTASPSSRYSRSTRL